VGDVRVSPLERPSGVVGGHHDDETWLVGGRAGGAVGGRAVTWAMHQAEAYSITIGRNEASAPRYDRHVLTSAPARLRAGVFVGTFGAVTAVLLWLVRPLSGGPAASDAASSVLFWDRIVSGRHLEVFLNTTPKPLLTVVYGLLHEVDPGWRLVSVAAILATATGIVLAGEVVRRAVGIGGAAFAVVALTGSLPLASNASWAYGLGWALALWMAAALALLRPNPRYALAGAFLAVAGLVRPETFILLGVAVLALVGAALRGRPAPPRAWLIMIGFLAIAGLCLHDLLLTGTPLWWLSVAPHAVEINGGRSRSLPSTIRMALNLLLAQWPLAIVGAVGGVIALRRGAWIVAGGLVVLGPLVILATWFLAFRHIEVVGHYLHPVQLAMILGSAVAVGFALSVAQHGLAARIARLDGAPGQLLVMLVASALAVIASRPFTPLSASARGTVALEGALDARATRALATLQSTMPPRKVPLAADPGPLGSADPEFLTVLVPRHRLPRSAVDLDLPLTSIAVLRSKDVDLASGYPRANSIVYLDGKIDPGSIVDETAPLRVSVPTRVDGVTIVPVEVNAAEQIWIVLVTAAP
jgi:hypothetical protein